MSGQEQEPTPATLQMWKEQRERMGEFPPRIRPTIGDRIVEVLAKYNVALPNAALDALADAMERMIETRGSRP